MGRNAPPPIPMGDESAEALTARKKELAKALSDPDKAAQLLVISTHFADKIKKGEGDDIPKDEREDYETIKSMLPMNGIYNGLSLEEAMDAWRTFVAEREAKASKDTEKPKLTYEEGMAQQKAALEGAFAAWKAERDAKGSDAIAGDAE